MRAVIRPLWTASLLAIALTGCGRGPGQQPVPASLFSIEAKVFRDNDTGIRDAMEEVIDTPEELRTVWQQVTSTQRTPVPLPEVDFQRNMLLLVAAGRMWDEDDVRVDSVSERRAQGQQILFVYYTIAEGCRRDRQNSYPVEIVRVRRYTGPTVRFMPVRQPATSCRS